jgi:hypothetical protein
MYDLSGSLDGVVPGRRVVRDLEVRRLDGRGTQGLEPLVAFGDLRHLTLERVSNLSLAPLEHLALESLRIEVAGGLDLGTLAPPATLRRLTLFDLDENCAVPKSLVLPSAFERLTVIETRAGHTGAVVQALLGAVDWSRLSGLESFDVRLGGLHDIEPIELDLSFVDSLPDLIYLWVTGVHHRGPGPSPLEPPFEGLSRKLRRLIFDADDPDAIRPAVQAYLGVPVSPLTEGISVRQRRPYKPPRPAWAILGPADGSGVCHVYGSLADAAGMTSDQTETQALRGARRRLREADPKLLRRLDFDPESSGTGISARSREDLERALRILGLAGTEQPR